MRTRKEICEEFQRLARKNSSPIPGSERRNFSEESFAQLGHDVHVLMLDLLLDIRDLLSQKPVSEKETP